MKTIGEIIRAHREQKGMLLRQLAALLEIDSAIISELFLLTGFSVNKTKIDFDETELSIEINDMCEFKTKILESIKEYSDLLTKKE